MLFFHNQLYQILKTPWFFDKYAMENNLQNKMQINFFLMASDNFDFDHVCHVNMYR